MKDVIMSRVLDTGAPGVSDQFVQSFPSQPHQHYTRSHLHHTYILQSRLIFSTGVHSLIVFQCSMSFPELRHWCPISKRWCYIRLKISATLNYKIGPHKQWPTLYHSSATGCKIYRDVTSCPNCTKIVQDIL
jgi:hypothetical protein